MKRSTRRNAALATAMFALAAAATFFSAREPTEPLTRETLAAARALWRLRGVPDYRLRYEMHGSVFDVEVRGGMVVSASANGTPIRSADPSAYSVEGLFDTLTLELENRADPRGPFAAQAATLVMRVRFNADFGYVERYLRSSGGMGRGASIVVHEFTRLNVGRRGDSAAS